MTNRNIPLLTLCAALSLMLLSCGVTTVPPAISPEWIAYNSSQDGVLGIYAIRADGAASPVMLTAHQNSEEGPTWAPDGMTLAFVSNRDGNPEIYRINSDGSDPTRLTNNPAADTMPAWSPNGTAIAFVSNRDNGQTDIYVMDSEGGSVTRLTNDRAFEAWPAWSPDGESIAFDSNQTGEWQIYVMQADGKVPEQITDGSENGWAAWSPDGSRIAFSSERDGNLEICVMDADGGNTTRLTESGGRDIFPAWSPDGGTIAFSSERGGTDGSRDIYVMNSDGSNVRQLTSDPSDENQPRWSAVGVVEVGGLETVISDEPWFGTPQCERDTDGDGEPDTPTTAFPTTDQTAYVTFLFGHMQNGMTWGWSAPLIQSNFVASGYWEEGPAGRYVYSLPLAERGPGVFSVSFSLGNARHTVECSVIEP